MCPPLLPPKISPYKKDQHVSALRTQTLMNNKRSNQSPVKSKSIGTQTESYIDSKKSQIDFSEIIDYLRKNLLGQVLKFDKNTLTITDCTIQFKNKDEKAGKLLIEPDKSLSIGNIPPGFVLENCGFERRFNPVDSVNVSNTNNSSIFLFDNLNCDLRNVQFDSRKVINKKNAGCISIKKRSAKPSFGNHVKVLLHKLPNGLVNACLNGKAVKVDTQEFHSKGLFFRRHNLKISPKKPSTKTKPHDCNSTYSSISNLNLLDKQKCHIGDRETDLQSSENNKKEDIPNEITQSNILTSQDDKSEDIPIEMTHSCITSSEANTHKSTRARDLESSEDNKIKEVLTEIMHPCTLTSKLGEHKCHIGVRGTNIISLGPNFKTNTPTIGTPEQDNEKITNEITIVKQSENFNLEKSCCDSYTCHKSLSDHMKIRLEIDVEDELKPNKYHIRLRETHLQSVEDNRTENISSEISQPSPVSPNPKEKIYISRPETPMDKNEAIINEITVVEESLSPELLLPEKQRFNCDFCSKTFKFHQSLNFHKKTVHGVVENGPRPKEESPLHATELCPECPRGFKKPSDLDRHLLETHKIVLKKSSYNCDFCLQTFMTFKSLMYHKKKRHNVKTNEHFVLKTECPNCKKLFEIASYYSSNHFEECVIKKNATHYNYSINEELEMFTQDSVDMTMDDPMPIYFHEEVLETHQINGMPDSDITEETINRKKRKYFLEMRKEKKLEEDESDEFINKVELLESTEGPNDITFEEID